MDEETIFEGVKTGELIGEEVPAKRERDSYDRFFHVSPPSAMLAF